MREERRNQVPLGSYAVYFCGSKLTVHGETSPGTPSWRLDQLQPRVKLPPKLVKVEGETVDQRNTRSRSNFSSFVFFFSLLLRYYSLIIPRKINCSVNCSLVFIQVVLQSFRPKVENRRDISIRAQVRNTRYKNINRIKLDFLRSSRSNDWNILSYF